MKRFRFLNISLISFILILTMTFPGFAATKKAIKSVTIRATYTDYEAEDSDDESGIEIVSSGTGYELDHYEIENMEEVWSEGTTPVATVYLTAKDGYYFSITKASQIKLQRCKYKSAARQDSSTTLVVTVELTDVQKKVGEVEELTLNDDGKASWGEVNNAGSYEIRVFRNDTRVASETVNDTTFDISPYLTRGGSYRYRIRAIHKADANVRGEWAESNDIYLSDEKAKANREAAEAAESAGEWIQDASGWRFRLPDGTFVTNAWRRINKNWYYFLPDSHIARGWAQVDGAWYYFDPATGAMWVNTTTPDGYTLGIDGRRAE